MNYEPEFVFKTTFSVVLTAYFFNYGLGAYFTPTLDYYFFSAMGLCFSTETSGFHILLLPDVHFLSIGSTINS